LSSELRPNAIIDKAKQQEEKCDWSKAAEYYEEALRAESMTVPFAAETWDRIGFCYTRASTQTEDLEGFRKIRQLAVEAYKSAAKLFEKEEGLKNQGRSAQCYAIAEYVRSWLASNPSEKKTMLDECRSLGKKSLEAYGNAGEELSYGKMCNDLLLCLLERLYVASDSREMRDVAQEGIDWADKAIAVLSRLENKSELLRAYFTASLQSWYAYISEEEEKGNELMRRSLSYSEKALELSREVDNVYYSAMSDWAAAFCNLLFTGKVESAAEYANEMLQKGMILRDNYLKGVASYVLAFATDWMVLKEEDPDKKKEGYGRIIKYAEDAIGFLQLVSQDFFIAGTCLFYAESYSSQASEIEANPTEKRALIGKALEIGRKGLEHATRSGSPDSQISTLHALSKALHFYSKLETVEDEKTKLLKEALIHRKRMINISEIAFPFNDWARGCGKTYEGLIKVDMARVETDKDKKTATLKDAVLDIEDGVSHSRKWVLSHQVPSYIAAVAGFEDSFGRTLDDLYLLIEDEENLNRAIEVYDVAATKFKKINLPSRAAESYWKMARNLDRLGDHQKAAEIFENAFTEYKAAAQKILHFTDFYLDYAAYMKAWSEIERAKFTHKHEEYSNAMKHYENTANLLKTSKLWSYLSSNFLAWSLLEQAEDFSRKENSNESIDAFKKAAELFKEAQEAIEEETGKIKVQDEKEKAVELGRASLRRIEYCQARANVERARMHDREGEYAKSADHYGFAATTFGKIMETMESETERKEIEPIVYMCLAWRKMKMADCSDVPELYHEASELFAKAKEHCPKDRTSLLASGNSALCKALEFGTKFQETREKESFSKAKQFLESAANYYLKTGLENASMWTSATEILFDAYSYMSSAEIEVDPKKRMETYLLAEKCLERSAGFYANAGYIGKRDEVLKTLKNVKEKRRFALSLGEILAAPVEASSTHMISAPSMTVEEPVGFSKFESEFVQANLITNKRELVFGENLNLEVHIANFGKNTAFLMRIEDIVPEAFDLVEKPPRGVVNGGFLDLKGRKLAPLETEEVKLTFRPRKKGGFVLRPKIQYMNEAGDHKACELEQVTVTVKELGIRGWIKGSG